MSFNDVENREWKQLMPGIRARTFWGDQMMVCVSRASSDRLVLDL